MTHPIIKTEKMKLQLTYTKNEDGTEYLLCNEKDNFYHLPLNNAPTLEGVLLLPPLEDEARKLALEIGEDYFSKELFADYFTIGYNKTKEKYDTLLKEVLMEFDLAIKKHLLLYPIEHSVHGKMCDGINEIRSKIIQSLQQQKYPVAFECEMELVDNQDFMDFEEDATTFPSSIESTEQPKTITNSQGLTQLVGKYIY